MQYCLSQKIVSHIYLVITNLSGFTRNVSAGTALGVAEPVKMVSSFEDEIDTTATDRADVWNLSSTTEGSRKKCMLELLKFDEVLPAEVNQLKEFLMQHHFFSLEDSERGETDIITMSINTGDSQPVKQPPRLMPFIARGEVAMQLHDMQQTGVSQPSSSPWSSPFVMVRKKDGSHRFYFEYRQLNALTKTDAFPLQRIDDLLDQLRGELTSGFWQIRMESESREKTAFTTPQGLYEFFVMPFGLTNAPTVFQRLMQRILSGLNPSDGKEFITAYLDDILVFSSSFSDQLDHLYTEGSQPTEVCEFEAKTIKMPVHEKRS